MYENGTLIELKVYITSVTTGLYIWFSLLKMSTTVSVKVFGRCCRCCLETVGSMTPIFSGCLNGMFNEVTRLQITKDDRYPQQMCSRCILKLSSAHNFYHMVMKNHKSLETALKEAESQKNSEELPLFENVEYEVIKIEPKEFTASNEAESFLKEPNPEPINPSLEKISKEVSDSEDNLCPQCGHKSLTQNGLKVHLETHVSKDTVPSVLPKSPHLCSLCGKKYRLRTSLAKHMRYHRGNLFQCKYCDKRFAEASTLKVHLVSHNLINPKPFWCGTCKKVFSQKSSLRKHEKIHTFPAGHSCDRCDKTFRQTYTLQKHCVREHDSVQCELCSEYFVGKKGLDVHMKTHKACNLWGKTKTEANNTIDQVDVESVKVEFLCMLCITKFQSKEGLEAHVCTRDNMT